MSVAVALALILIQQANPTLAGSQTPAVAPQSNTRVPATAGRTSDRDDEIICRREHILGSNRPKRVCAPRREWAQARDNAQEAIQNSNSREAPEALPSM